MTGEMDQVRRAADHIKNRDGAAMEAHQHRRGHRLELEASRIAGCFYCCKTFGPGQIEEWVDDGQCALCPKCGIDSVIGDASGFPAHDVQFLKQMNAIWF